MEDGGGKGGDVLCATPWVRHLPLTWMSQQQPNRSACPGPLVQARPQWLRTGTWRVPASSVSCSTFNPAIPQTSNTPRELVGGGAPSPAPPATLGMEGELKLLPSCQPASWWDSISLICAYLQPQEPWVPGHCAHQSRCVRVLGPPNQLPGWRPDNRCSFAPSSGDQKSKAGGLQSRFLLGCEEQLPQPLPGFLGWAGHLVVLGLWLVASDLCPCCHTAFTLCARLCVSFFLFRRTPDILD